MGYIVVGRLLAAYMYEQAIADDDGMGDDSSAGGELSKTCLGSSCFRYTHLLCAVSALCSASPPSLPREAVSLWPCARLELRAAVCRGYAW